MGFANRYSALDRLLHHLAFATRQAQIGMADVENLLFRAQLGRHTLDRPLFITALPRAGTTLLLELCVRSRAFVSHTYRQMPFVLIPMLWNSFSTGFRRADTPRERAHGDGMLVSVDSPEAFEEMVWMAFWPHHYTRDRILPWRQEDDSVFREFLASHCTKIVALAVTAGDGMADLPTAPPRYVSKNNLNIARLAWLARNFRDALFVIPFREPLQHGTSLLRQHLNFLEIHRSDPFAKRYMQGIGHFDFGATLRPVDFNGWLDRATPGDPRAMGFWLEYWHAAYQSLLAEATERVCFVHYEALCADPWVGLERMAHFIQIENTGALLAQADRMHAPSAYDIDGASLDATVVHKVQALYARLVARSVI